MLPPPLWAALMVGELIAKFLSSLKEFTQAETQAAKVCALSLGRSVSGASYYIHTRIHSTELTHR